MRQSTHYYTSIVVKIRLYITISILWILGRKYGCTDHGCGQTFRSKNAWKCHEREYTQVEAWRCGELLCGCGLQCGLLVYRERNLLLHRRREHCNFDEATEENRIGCRYNHQFWCGLCDEIVWSGRSGMNGQEYRFAHIEEHIEKYRTSIARWGGAGDKYLWPLMPGPGHSASLIMNLALIVCWVWKYEA